MCILRFTVRNLWITVCCKLWITTKEVNNTVKNCLRKVRRDHDENQQALADSVGVSRRSIIQIEKERVVSNGLLMIVIAQRYNMNVTEFFL